MRAIQHHCHELSLGATDVATEAEGADGASVAEEADGASVGGMPLGATDVTTDAEDADGTSVAEEADGASVVAASLGSGHTDCHELSLRATDVATGAEEADGASAVAASLGAAMGTGPGRTGLPGGVGGRSCAAIWSMPEKMISACTAE